jgi:uncharacterized protein YndB with AHSA1/START domain
MVSMTKNEAGVARYELAIDIDAPPERVWQAIIEDTNAWWLPDFHMTGAESTVTFDARAGGGIVETMPGGGSLLWYTVHWIRPEEHTVYLVGHIAPDWGGPATTSLKIAVVADGSGSTLHVSDAHHGFVDEKNLASLHTGWTTLFTDGLKHFIEDGS